MADPGDLSLLINHLFLPPKLPQSSDDDDGHVLIINRIVQAVQDFQSTIKVIPGTHQGVWVSVVNMLTRMRRAHQHNHLTKAGLSKILEKLPVGGVLPLHISSQNAGLIIRKPALNIFTVEGFEASLPAATVTGAPGRLVATFPATPRLALPVSAHTPLAALLAELDHEPLVAAMPQTKKAGSVQVETRDTADPRYVTEILAGISAGLLTDGDLEKVAASTVRVTKRLADLVLWSNTELPWRRSPKWLIIRVALQTTLQGVHQLYGYKMFVAYLLAGVLKDACRQGHEQPPHLVDVMRAKLARRVYKMSDVVDPNPSNPVIAYIIEAIDEACTYLRANAERIRAEQRRPLGWSAPSQTELEDAQNFSMKHSLSYIKEIQDRTERLKNAHDDFDYNACNARLLREAGTMSSAIPPVISDTSDLDRLSSILEIERWATIDLPRWADTPAFSFEKLGRTIVAHLQVASGSYSHSPEIFSRMVLTIFEMWVVLDRKTISEIPLLAQYMLDIPVTLLEPLLLRTRQEMERLHAVENYLAQRHAGTTSRQSPIYQRDAQYDTFQVKYVESSLGRPLVALRRKITAKAATDKANKERELADSQAEYQRLLNEASRLSCDYVSGRDSYGYYYNYHSACCSKCAIERQARGMKITIFEWPLPEQDTKCKRAVFELRPPPTFAIWRYITHEMIHAFAKSVTADSDRASVEQHLTEYQPLAAHVCKPPLGSVLSLASTAKSFLRSHYATVEVSVATHSSVVKNHPLILEFYDKGHSVWLSMPKNVNIRDRCTFMLPQGPYTPLQFAVSGTVHTPNTVIARQSSCAAKMSLHEWDAFGHLRAGHRLQWRNIALQLHTSNLTFSDPAVHLLVLQAAWQAEAAESTAGADNKVWRQVHADLIDESFGREVLAALRTKLNMIQDNWQEAWTLMTLAILACRLHSLTLSAEVESQVLKYLARIRGLASEWLRKVVDAHRERIETGTPSQAEQAQSRQRIILIAATVRSTFDVRIETLQRILSDPSALAQFAEASFRICSHSPAKTNDLPSVLRLIAERDQLLALRSVDTVWKTLSEQPSILSSAVRSIWSTFSSMSGQPCGLSSAVRSIWSTFTSEASWVRLNSYWVYIFTSTTSASQQRCVHVNLRDGQLLVDGKTLGNLPQSITGTASFCVIFPGYYTMEAVSSTMPGMEYELRRQFFDKEVHMLQNGKDIIIRTRDTQGSKNSGRISEFIPSHHLSLDIPHALASNSAHWFYEEPSGWSIDFRTRSDPLAASALRWKMETANQCHRLRNIQRPEIVLDPHSQAMSRVFSVLHRLESSPLHVLAICQSNGAALENLVIELPRYKLSFSIAADKALESRDIINMVVSDDQNIGALYGLQSGIVLQARGLSSRQLLLPFTTNVQISHGKEHHPMISAHPSSETYVPHIVLDIDPVLARLHGNGGTLSSWLYCILLHALTSSHAPDPLTGQTGTEVAVAMLQNATSLSFMRLEARDCTVLSKISKLTPSRVCYPPHLSVMQQEEWHTILSPCAQDDRYAALVQHILKHAQELATIDTSSHSPDLRMGTDEHLRRRAETRVGLFQRPVRTGNEARASDTTAVLRGSLLSERARQRTAPVVAISSLVTRWPSSVAVVQDLWYRFQQWAVISKPSYSPDLDLTNMHIWLRRNLKEMWLALLHLSHGASRDDLLFALSVISYHHDDGLALAKTLLACAVHELPRHPIPQWGDEPHFDLTRGYEVSQADIEALAEQFCHSFTPNPYESEEDTQRSAAIHRSRRQQQIQGIARRLCSQWPSSRISITPSTSVFNLVHVADLVDAVTALFARRYPSHLLHQFVLELQGDLDRHHSSQLGFSTVLPSLSLGLHVSSSSTRSTVITMASLIARAQRQFKKLTTPQKAKHTASRSHSENIPRQRIDQNDTHAESTELTTLVNGLGNENLHRRYSEDLRARINFLDTSSLPRSPGVSLHTIHQLSGTISLIQLSDILEPDAGALSENVLDRANLWPPITPTTLLSELRLDARHRHGAKSREALVRFAQGILLSQKHGRVEMLLKAGLESEVTKERENMPTIGPVSEEHVDWLLVQIDAGFCIRGIQEDIAKRMMHPDGGANAVMQLNMGEGKSSVIVPIVCAALADGQKLVRVLVLKPLAPQMFQLLRRLSGLANRRIYYLPFNRGVPLDGTAIPRLRQMFETCARTGGVLLAQPEHILSLKLMTIDKIQSCGSDVLPSVPSGLYNLQSWLDKNSRDILDESDEILHTRYQLIYTCGNPAPLDGHPDRWVTLGEVFTVVLECLPHFSRQKNDGSLEVLGDCSDPSRFPITRILSRESDHPLLRDVARRIVYEDRLESLSFKSIEKDAYCFITDIDASQSISDRLRTKLEQEGTPFVFQGLLLLRGLFAHEILLSALRLKRWRVEYGLDPVRKPETLMAVPYRAKDSPSLRSEYGHPEMRLILTTLSYYYGGLTDSQLETTFERLFTANNPGMIYEEWVKRSKGINDNLRTLAGVNLEDYSLKHDTIFPQLRHNKFVIDFFLSQCVFPKEAKEFPHKLTTSGWDIARARPPQLVTGFSGTNDNKWLLPLDIRQLDSEAQRGTNAEVLNHLLRPENREVVPLAAPKAGGNIAEALVRRVLQLSPAVQVFLDVGAQVLEWENDELARKWLEMNTSPTIEAAIYFDQRDEPHVVHRQGRDQLLSESPYSSRLGSCLVYLDDAHTRGVDFKFPLGTRAAVTLGPRLTKDKLVQGCMRMRKLGQGHSVVFIAPEEICRAMNARNSTTHKLESSDVVAWTMRETVQQLEHNVPMWAAQGASFAHRLQAGKEYASNEIGTSAFGERIREPESRTLKELYDVQAAHDLFREVEVDYTGMLSHLRDRCVEYGVTSASRTQLQEEQERELSQEEEEEREVERAPSAGPARHTLEEDVRRFVKMGVIRPGSPTFRSLVECLAYTDVQGPPQWNRNYRILATHDFARTIKIAGDTKGAMVEFLRPVRWILSSESKVVLISPFEANELLPDVRRSPTVRLHLYSPKASRTVRYFDGLDFLTVASAPALIPRPLLGSVVEELNLFAGQLFLQNHEEYVHVCGLVKQKFGRDYRNSFKELFGYRRKGEGFMQTHMGKVLRGRDLQEQDFA